MAKKAAYGDWPVTLTDKVEVLAARHAALRAETQRAETAEAMTRLRLGEALLAALAARVKVEAELRVAQWARHAATARSSPDRRNRLRRLAEQALDRLTVPGRAVILARSGLWRTEGRGLRATIAALPAMARYAAQGPDPAVQPEALVDQAWYLRTYPDVGVAGMSPLIHYLLRGGYEHRSPHPLFDGAWYSRRNARELAATGLTALAHFVRCGAALGRDPHPLFDMAHYVSQALDLIESGENPLDHYLRTGAGSDLSPHPLFQPAYYRRQLAADERGENPLVHYLTVGSARGLKPHPLFDPAWYAAGYPAAAGWEPLSHFVEFAGDQLQSPGPWFDSHRYAQARGAARARSVDPLTDYLRGGAWSAATPAEGAHPVAFFAAHPELAASGVTPLEHWADREG
jgi:hypothetical protein